MIAFEMQIHMNSYYWWKKLYDFNNKMKPSLSYAKKSNLRNVSNLSKKLKNLHEWIFKPIYNHPVSLPDHSSALLNISFSQGIPQSPACYFLYPLADISILPVILSSRLWVSHIKFAKMWSTVQKTHKTHLSLWPTITSSYTFKAAS